MPASRADLLRPLPSLTEVRNRTPAADEELRCMSNHLVNKALLRPIEPGVALGGRLIGASNPYASQPSRVQLAASKPAHSPLSRAAAHSCSDLCRPSRAPHNPDPSTPRRPKPV